MCTVLLERSAITFLFYAFVEGYLMSLDIRRFEKAVCCFGKAVSLLLLYDVFLFLCLTVQASHRESLKQ